MIRESTQAAPPERFLNRVRGFLRYMRNEGRTPTNVVFFFIVAAILIVLLIITVFRLQPRYKMWSSNDLLLGIDWERSWLTSYRNRAGGNCRDRSGHEVEDRLGRRRAAMLGAEREPNPRVEAQHQPASLMERGCVHLAVPLVPFGVLSVDQIADEGDPAESVSDRGERLDFTLGLREAFGLVEHRQGAIDTVSLRRRYPMSRASSALVDTLAMATIWKGPFSSESRSYCTPF